MSTRSATVERLQALVGREVLHVERSAGGWPALARIETEGPPVSVALYIGMIGQSHRGRDLVERRFQNPSSRHPIQPQASRQLLLVGLWEEDRLHDVTRPVIASADAARRIDHRTRFSVFLRLDHLMAAETTGWAEETSGSGETIRYLAPAMLPLEATLRRKGLGIAQGEVRALADASGILDEWFHDDGGGAGWEIARNRARRSASVLVRSALFRRSVVDAYSGKCAMCGLGHGLVQGAHIYPASAPDSPDHVTNGLALCPNHHAAFDRHLVCVDPESRHVLLEDSLIRAAEASEITRLFVAGTLPRLAEPQHRRLRPRAEMFEGRYRHFDGAYSWAGF